MKIRKINPEALKDNPFKLIGKDWMLITAGNKDNFNPMTAAWGGFGVLWNKNVVLTYIRPQRYTYEFTENSEYFTLTFFEDQHRSALNFCGTKSGRDFDKAKEAGLTPLETEKGNIYFKEARLVIECRKLYADDLRKEAFIDKDMLKHYPDEDFHRYYVGEITDAFFIEK